MRIEPGIYQHFKGGRYQVLDTLLNPETNEQLVFYRHWPHGGNQWLRPAGMFFDGVKGSTRFILLEKRKPDFSSKKSRTVIAVHTETREEYDIQRIWQHGGFQFRLLGKAKHYSKEARDWI